MSAVICHYCRERVVQPVDAVGITSDHVMPRALGGCDHPQNRVPACGECNNAKADKFPACRCSNCLSAVQHYLDTPPHGKKPLTMRQHAKVVSRAIDHVQSILDEREDRRHAVARERYAEEAGWDWDALPPEEQRAWFRQWQEEREPRVNEAALRAVLHGKQKA